jgi:hypothetical protein
MNINSGARRPVVWPLNTGHMTNPDTRGALARSEKRRDEGKPREPAKSSMSMRTAGPVANMVNRGHRSHVGGAESPIGVQK